MADRRYHTDIASRFELDLSRHRNASRLRRSKVFWAAGAASLVACIVMLTASARPVQSRPVSAAHRLFEADCAKCHDRPFATLSHLKPIGTATHSVSNERCRKCHVEDSLDHHGSRMATDVDLNCATCHREHRGDVELARVADSFCIQCHADLKIAEAGATPRYEKKIATFAAHPEFIVRGPQRDAPTLDFKDGREPITLAKWDASAAQPGWRDNSAFHFNHALHLDPQGLPQPAGPNDPPEYVPRKKLDCRDCHVPTPDGAQMQPVNFASHCRSCHALNVETSGLDGAALTMGAEGLPHDKPELVRAFVRDRLTAAATAARKKPPAADLLKYEPAPPNALTDSERKWVGDELAKFEERLFGTPFKQTGASSSPASAEGLLSRSCTRCHQVESRPNAGPDDVHWAIVKPNIPDQWLSHSRFRHDRHDAFTTCTDCHYIDTKDGRPPRSDDKELSVRASLLATDILIPKIETCRACHGDAPAKNVTHGASGSCVECHGYHHPATPKSDDERFNFFRDESAD